MSAPTIYRLDIQRFRGIKNLPWFPGKGVNVILGGGDVGKTTILDAIGLLLSPTNATAIADTDYYARDIDAGFTIEAVFSLPASIGINDLPRQCWPWIWNGSEAVVPDTDGDGGDAAEQVYRLRVRGAEHDLFYEIVQPDGSTVVLPVALRRAIGLVRVSGDDRNDRDLRLVQGSALDRLISDKRLRSRLSTGLAKKGIKDELTEESKKVLDELDKDFAARNLPTGLDLAMTGGQGFAVTALIGLTATRGDVQLPLANWGAGTRRMAALAIAEQNQAEAPITLVDEIERGLEAYRQRSLMAKLQASQGQAFITTHSASVISAASDAAIWYLDGEGCIGSLDAAKIARHRNSDPETFLARLTIVAEGLTEVGFVTVILEKALGSPLPDHGIHVTDGTGHETALDLLEALAAGGLRFGGFADNETGKYPARWKKVAEKLGPLLFRWPTGCLEENVIGAMPDDRLESLFADDSGDSGARRRTLAERLDLEDKRFNAIRAKAGSDLRAYVIAAALGKVPEDKQAEKSQFQAHARIWFKSEDGGRDLALKMFSVCAWPVLRPLMLPFANAVRKALELPEIADLPL